MLVVVDTEGAGVGVAVGDALAVGDGLGVTVGDALATEGLAVGEAEDVDGFVLAV